MIFKKNASLPKRKYHDGDIIEFNFEPNSIDVYWYDIILIGVVTGVLYEKEGILYKVELKDNKRKIFGDVIVPEIHINRMIEDNAITARCNFCGKLIHVNEKDLDVQKIEEQKKWEKFYCLDKKHHILNICPICVDKEQDKLKCPYDNCDIISENQKALFQEKWDKITI